MKHNPSDSVRQGQPAADEPLSFDDLYREYGERILNVLYRFTSSEQAARDLLQDVFLKVYENLDSFERRSQVYTWIYRIAVNHALNYLKRERRHMWIDIMDESLGDFLRRDSLEVPGLTGTEAARPDEIVERKEMDQVVREAIDSLAPKYRIPFILFKDERLSYVEIGKVLGLSLSAVESRIHRARKMLIKKVSPFL